MDPLATLTLRDPVSSLTHLGTALFAVYVTLLFVRLSRGDALKRRALAVFGGSMILLYAASGLYHAVPGSAGTAVIAWYRRLDVSAIFLLIAGTFTPIMAVLLADPLRRTMLTLMWFLAGAGITLLWVGPAVPHPVTVCTFVAAGLPGFLPARQYAQAVGRRALVWGVAGAAFYGLGGICDVADWPNPLPGMVNAHELTHLLDMAGTACHVLFVVRYVVPFERPAECRREVEAALAGNA